MKQNSAMLKGVKENPAPLGLVHDRLIIPSCATTCRNSYYMTNVSVVVMQVVKK